ncbi:hypothetical protein QUF65_02370 [Lysinibacillus sphaericus]|uniref:hypothetical protein n=2 Tax=Lysinibacillus sphaericus TaxID=1421 RepID=UPI0019419D23|nr:hypothetical protein [Lysinibacillus sphaericus]MDM5349730.1 hypothetical protein [Lysinibacillus sphaericus]QPA57031.1 hypothetical protein INQ55_12345 [Lysinibacillus sphaericus]
MEQLRMFIAEGAEVVLEESEIVTFNEIPTFEEGRITTFGSISESKLKITGKAVKLSNNH